MPKAVKTRIDKYVVKIIFRQLKRIADLQTQVNLVEDEINKIVDNFKEKTGREVDVVKIEKDGNRYKLIMEVY